MMKARLFSFFLGATVVAGLADFNARAVYTVMNGPTPALVFISGSVLDSSNLPISGVAVVASAMVGTNYQSLTNLTDSSGHYNTLVASNTTWSVGVSSASLNNLPGCYNSVVDNITVRIGAASGTANFIVPDCGAGAELDGYLVDQNNNPIAGVGISASTSDGYTTQNATTDANGFYEFILQNGYYDVELNCTNLTSLGFQCVSGQTNVAVGFDYTYQQNFLTQPVGQPAFGPFFTGQAPLQNGWFYLGTVGSDADAFGYYNLLNYPYINHLDLGWEYCTDAGNAAHGAFFYDFTDSVWFYTEPGTFPYLYDFNSNAWMYFAPQNGAIDRYQSGPRWFYNTSTKAWGNHL